jgi:pimeloyl-ACP methyl ester carboxylesterase
LWGIEQMAFIQVAAHDKSCRPGKTDTRLQAALSDAQEDGQEEDSPSTGPIIVMIHGYKFAPGHPISCPHRHILSLSNPSDCWKAKSWPRALGFGSGFADEGLGVGFGWHARGTIWQAYEEAGRAGAALAQLVAQIRQHAPGRDVHFFCHSLGARVALSGLHDLEPGAVRRVIMLNAAEFGTPARAAMDTPAGQGAEFINVTSRENDLFDFLMERLMRFERGFDRTLSLAMPRAHNTLNIQIDKPEALATLALAGFPIAPPRGRICHWSAYLRPGVFELYRALLREPERMSLAVLKERLPADHDARWSRLVPVPRVSSAAIWPFGAEA